MFIVKGTLSATRSCPMCKKELTKQGQEEVTCSCGWVWTEPKIAQISAGIQGQAKV